MNSVYVFLADGFEEVEALTVVDVLRRANLKVRMVSVTPNEIVVGAHDVSLLCDKNIDNCDFLDTAALVLPGGMPGAETLGKHKHLADVLCKHHKKGTTIAAICAAPMVLGKLGLLEGKKATCYPGFEEFLIGAEKLDAPVVVDGNVITGDGPGAAMAFALELVKTLVSEEKAEELSQAMRLH